MTSAVNAAVGTGPPQARKRPRLIGRLTTGLPGFTVRRLLRLVVSVFVLVTATFAMVHMIPGDPVRATLGQGATPQLVALRRHQLGLDKPIVSQYLDYLHGVVTGNLGTSIVSNERVSTILAFRLPNTLQLAIPAFVLVLLVSLPLGLVMAVRTQGGRGERTRLAFVGLTGVVNSIPNFIWATILSAVFVVWLKVFPVAGNSGFSSHVLPVLALAATPIASLSRIARVEALKVLGSDYIRAARGRRLPWRLLYLRHALPNMITASLTYSGMILSGLIAGTVLVETVFAWPGLGSEVSQAVIGKDYPLIQGILLVLGTMVLVIHLLVDLILAALDPQSRIRES